jgi:hypothetical protein
MFARLMNAIYPPGAPSALVVVGKSDASILHLVPEDSSVERFGITKSSSNTTFRHRGATEQTREQIGTITLHVGDGEGPDEFLDDVETRACTLWNDSRSSSTAQVQGASVETIQLLQEVLEQAALDAILSGEGRDRSMNATQISPVFVLRVVRARPGRIITARELRSI